MKYTRENIVEGIYKKIDETEGATNGMKRLWKEELPQYPIEIEQNVLEWINDEPITEVDCHGESVKRVMDMFGLTEKQLPYLIQNFIDYKKCGFRVYAKCYGVYGAYVDQE